MAYRRQPLVELGGFDPSFFYGNEDVDLAWRMMKRGPVLFHDQMIIVHPPVPRSLLKFIRHPETYGVIILLYRKHPRQFLMVHKRHPLYIIYLAISLRYFIHELTGYRKLLYREPFTFIKLILGLILQRFWVVFLTPKFILMSLGILKQSRAYT
jgi:GT2 family glycosyltransferase